MGTTNNKGNGFLRAQTSKGVKITRLRLVLFYSGNLYAKKNKIIIIIINRFGIALMASIAHSTYVYPY